VADRPASLESGLVPPLSSLQRSLPAGTLVISAFQNVAASVLADLSHEVDCDIIVAETIKRRVNAAARSSRQ
jgi:predicted dinucleotide-binding enzyme